jgi:hypothetical protein
LYPLLAQKAKNILNKKTFTSARFTLLENLKKKTIESIPSLFTEENCNGKFPFVISYENNDEIKKLKKLH